MRRQEALREATAALWAAGVPDAAGDARRLLAHAAGIAPERLMLHLQDEPQEYEKKMFLELVARRSRREPVSHLTGMRLFWGRVFAVGPVVLDPRPETEVLVAAALEEPYERVLDLGTGSGCLLATLLAERPQASGLGVDISPAALEVAASNLARHRLLDRAELALSDWLSGVGGAFDLIVGNPPYIAAEEMPRLEPEVRDWEPRIALTDGADGLGAYRAILAGAEPHLRSGGRLLLEHGPGQAEPIAAIGRDAGWPEPERRRDLDGRDRACLFRRP